MNDLTATHRRAFFDHIPKTGGTACFEYFRQCMGDQAISPFVMFELVPDALAKHSRRALISGHFEPLPGSLPSDRLTLTVLRDPVDRVLSEYSALLYDELVEPGEQFEAIRRLRRTPLLDSLLDEDPRVSVIFRNRQTRHFAGYILTPSRTASDEELLDCAKRAIAEFDLVGIHEDLDGFLDLACEALGIAIPRILPTHNVTSKKVSFAALSNRERELLTTLNRADIELFGFAKQHYRAIRRQAIRRLTESRPVQVGADQPHIYRRLPSQRDEAPPSAAHADFGTREVEILGVSVKGNISNSCEVFSGEHTTIQVAFRAHIAESDLTVGLRLFDAAGALIYGTNTYHQGLSVQVSHPGEYFVEFSFRMSLGLGEYRIGISLHTGVAHTERCFHWKDNAGRFAAVGNIEEHFEGIANLCTSVHGGSHESEASLALLPRANVVGKSRSLVVHSPGVLSPVATIAAPSATVESQPEEAFSMTIAVTNAGAESWPCGGTRPVHCTYHIFGRDGNCVLYDGLRTRLRGNVGPGETVQLIVAIVAPIEEGTYQVELDLVQESVSWFRASGATCFTLTVLKAHDEISH